MGNSRLQHKDSFFFSASYTVWLWQLFEPSSGWHLSTVVNLFWANSKKKERKKDMISLCSCWRTVKSESERLPHEAMLSLSEAVIQNARCSLQGVPGLFPQMNYSPAPFLPRVGSSAFIPAFQPHFFSKFLRCNHMTDENPVESLCSPG